MVGKIYSFIFKKLWKWLAMRNELHKIKDTRRQKILSQYILNEDQKKQIDALFVGYYGRKIPYDWHKYFSSYTGKFDARFIPELLYIPIIEKKFNNEKYVDAVADKNLLEYFVGKTDNVRTPKVYLSSVNGLLRNEEKSIVDTYQAQEILKNSTCFGKPTVDSCSGNGCAVFEFDNGFDVLTGKTVLEVIKHMGSDFCFQEIVSNCDSVKSIHPQSLNTFRITTYLWKNKVYHFPVIMRIGKGSSVLDNAHQGGMFIGVSDDGYLCECAFTEFQERYYTHPDTGVIFKGYRVPETSFAIDAVEKIHQRIPQMGMISWDVVVNERNEAIIIEMNVKGQSIWLPQMAHGVGAFGENTSEILKWISK